MPEGCHIDEVVSSWASVCEYAERLGSRQALSVLWNEISHLRGELLRVVAPRQGEAAAAPGAAHDGKRELDERILALDRDATVRRLTAEVAAYNACIQELFAHIDATLAPNVSDDQWIRTRSELTARLVSQVARAAAEAAESEERRKRELEATRTQAPTSSEPPQHAAESSLNSQKEEGSEKQQGSESGGASASPVQVRVSNIEPTPQHPHTNPHAHPTLPLDIGILSSPAVSYTGVLEASPMPHDKSLEARLAAAERRVEELQNALRSTRKENRDLRRLGQTLHTQLRATATGGGGPGAAAGDGGGVS